MKTKANDPVDWSQYVSIDGTNIEATNPGLTKRELIAAMALQGYLSGNPQARLYTYSELAVKAADALIKELNKGGE